MVEGNAGQSLSHVAIGMWPRSQRYKERLGEPRHRSRFRLYWSWRRVSGNSPSVDEAQPFRHECTNEHTGQVCSVLFGYILLALPSILISSVFSPSVVPPCSSPLILPCPMSSVRSEKRKRKSSLLPHVFEYLLILISLPSHLCSGNMLPCSGLLKVFRGSLTWQWNKYTPTVMLHLKYQAS